jgi:hypothetical protein
MARKPSIAGGAEAKVLSKAVPARGKGWACQKPGGTTREGGTDMRNKTKIRTQGSNGNIFADLELPNPEQDLLKAQLAFQIFKIIKQRGLTHSTSSKRTVYGGRFAATSLKLPLRRLDRVARGDRRGFSKLH